MTDGRCPWGAGRNEDYTAYHDDEWGRPVTDEHGVYERLVLEGFQAGLSWQTILRKRESFRRAFEGFDPDVVAAFGERDIRRLLDDASIVRHRGKIEAAIGNARATVDLRASGGLPAMVWSRATDRPAWSSMADVPAETQASRDLSKALKLAGFRFVGPTTMYAAMQAMGVVNDHVAGCPAWAACEVARRAVDRPPW